jgi:hypothetical protein
VGDRQRVCSDPECQRKRQAQNQAAWLARQPGYFLARRIAERAMRREETGRDVPMRAPGAMTRLPWDLAQEELGVQATDFIWQFGKVLTRQAQEEMRFQAAVIAKEIPKQCTAPPKEERLVKA